MSETTVVFIKGWRLNLRPDEAADVPKFTFAVNDPDTRRYMGNIVPKTTEDEVQWRLGLSQRKPNNIVLVIDVNGKAIGTIGIHQIDWIARTAVTGSMIWDKDYRGKGYATEAKMLLLEYAFNTLNLRKIYSEVMGPNEASLDYAERCGYVEEACIPNHYFRDGIYQDKYILAVYKKPWKKLWRTYQKTYGQKP